MHRNTFIQFLRYEKRFSPHTVLAYQNDLDQFLRYLETIYGIDKADQITHTHVRSWVVEMMSEGYSARSVRRKLSTLKTWFHFLMKRGPYSMIRCLRSIYPRWKNACRRWCDQKVWIFFFRDSFWQ